MVRDDTVGSALVWRHTISGCRSQLTFPAVSTHLDIPGVGQRDHPSEAF